MPTNIEQKLRIAISEQLGIPEDEITADSTFAQDLGADSLDAVEIVMIAEEEFRIEVDEEQAESLKTFGELCDHIERARAPKSRGAKAAGGGARPARPTKSKGTKSAKGAKGAKGAKKGAKKGAAGRARSAAKSTAKTTRAGKGSAKGGAKGSKRRR